MELLTPNIGLVAWTLVVFAAIYFALKKFAWPLILNTVREREEAIADAIATANKIKAELVEARKEQELFLEQAHKEREIMIAEAHNISSHIIVNAKNEMRIKCEVVVDSALKAIQQQKDTSLEEALIHVEELATEASEKLLNRKLSLDTKQGYPELME